VRNGIVPAVAAAAHCPALIFAPGRVFFMLAFLPHIRRLFAPLRRRGPSDGPTPVGTLLRRRQIITEEQLQQALSVQRDRLTCMAQPAQIGSILVELGHAAETEVIGAINDHYGLSLTSLSDNVEERINRRHGGLLQRLAIRPVPIWLKLTVMTTLVVALTIAALSALTLRQQRDQLFQQIVRNGKISLNYFIANARFLLLEENNVLPLNTLITEAVSVEGIRYAIIQDAEGTVVAHTDYDQIGGPLRKFPDAGPSTRDGETVYFEYTAPDGERLLNLHRPVALKGRVLGEAHVGVSLDVIEMLVYRRGQTLILFSLITVAAGVLVAVALGIHFSRPIFQLVQATQEIARGHYQHRVAPQRNDEFGDLAAAFNRMARELGLKSIMERSFGKYVGTEILEMILDDPDRVWFKGQRREATVLFTDVRGFTRYTRVREPERVVERLNEYFEIASETIIRYGGYVDKFVGDAVLGVFNVPVARPDHVERAVRAALEMQAAFGERAAGQKDPLLDAVGVGIHTGVVVSGNLGSQVKMEYTVIGDAVNLASRINGLAASGEVIVSRAVRDRLGREVRAETRPPAAVKGAEAPVETFRILAMEGEWTDEATDHRGRDGRGERSA
jgi:adenylate cyclase